MKRKLSQEETKLNLQAIDRLKEDLDYQKYLFSFHTLQFEKGHFQTYLLNLKKTKMALKETTENIKILNNNINILEEQIRNGVQKKEVKK